jgi:hypothetical protein
VTEALRADLVPCIASDIARYSRRSAEDHPRRFDVGEHVADRAPLKLGA